MSNERGKTQTTDQPTPGEWMREKHPDSWHGSDRPTKGSMMSSQNHRTETTIRDALTGAGDNAQATMDAIETAFIAGFEAGQRCKPEEWLGEFTEWMKKQAMRGLDDFPDVQKTPRETADIVEELG